MYISRGDLKNFIILIVLVCTAIAVKADPPEGDWEKVLIEDTVLITNGFKFNLRQRDLFDSNLNNIFTLNTPNIATLHSVL